MSRPLPSGQSENSRARFSRWWVLLAACPLAAVLLAACGAADTLQPPPADAVVSVRVIPGSATVILGDTAQLAVLVEDEFGRALAVPVTWRSLDPSVATVEHGVVQGSAAGQTRIVVTAGQLADTALVTVTELAGVRESQSIGAAAVMTLGARGGLVYDIPDLLLAGDDDVGGFVPLQGIVRYSLDGIPLGVLIEHARIRVAMEHGGVFGEPFSLGTLFAERAAGEALNLQPPSSSAVPLALAFTPSPVADVTELVRAAYRAGERSVLLRFRFAQHGNANGAADQLEMTARELEVGYLR